MIIQFDVRTLYFVGAATSVMCGVMLWMSRRLHRPSHAALEWWAVGLLCGGASMLLLSVRGLVPDFLSYVLANTLGPWAAVLMYEGVRRFGNAPPAPWLAAGAGVGIGLLQVFLGSTADAHEARMLIASAVQGGFAAASIPVLRRRLDADPRVPLRWAIGFCAVFVITHTLRFAYTLVVGAPVSATGMVAGAPGHLVMPTLFALAPIAYALILLSLVNGRVAAELWAIATIDPLTGVRNRRSFIDKSRSVLASVAASDVAARMAVESAGRPQGVLLLLDLDHFKQINDQYGHAGGDRVLVRFAELLRTMMPLGAVVGRYGGEEFCVLLPSALLEEGAALAQAICNRVSSAAFSGGDPALIATVSIGVAGASDGQTLEELLVTADRRLYLAKDRGRNQAVASDESMACLDLSRPDRSNAMLVLI